MAHGRVFAMTDQRATTFWETQAERGTAVMMRLLRWIALHLGRRVARWVLYPLTAYFVLTSAATRRASRDFLVRVLPAPPTFRDVLRHVFTFASVSLDRVFFLTGSHAFNVTAHGDAPVAALARAGGTLLFVAHFGSFEVMRIGAVRQWRLPLRIVLDGNVGRNFMTALAELNPALAAGIINSADRGFDHVLKIREALADGATVGMMVDRVRDGERAVAVEFLGATARFPAGPWLVAAALRVPVVVAFAAWQGHDRYQLQFEVFAPLIELPRERRAAALQEVVQRYADRLGLAVRAAPYNWANFYDFWPR
jgi:predicted LPLAT superfamily acyltransferase